MNHTTNYNLPLYTATDETNYMTNWNGAMTSIDTAVKGIDTAVKGIDTAVKGIDTDVQELSETVQENDNNTKTEINNLSHNFNSLTETSAPVLNLTTNDFSIDGNYYQYIFTPSKTSLYTINITGTFRFNTGPKEVALTLSVFNNANLLGETRSFRYFSSDMSGSMTLTFTLMIKANSNIKLRITKHPDSTGMNALIIG